MAHVPAYQAILNELNRDVARAQPEDVLQFCANWFNSKLEEQRTVTRHSSPTSSNFDKEFPAQSLPPMAAHPAGPSGSSSQSGPIRNKGSTPSLVGHGYTFGSQASNNPPEPSQSEPMMSPYSEIGPTATSAEQPPGPFSQDAQSLTRPSPAASTSSAQSVSHSGISNIPWSKAGGAALDDTQSRKDSNATTDSEDTNNEELSSRGSGHGSAAPSAPTTPFGIPLTYNLGRRTSVSAESLDPTLAQPLNKIVIPKTASQRARIEASIKGNLLFRNLDEDQHNDVLNAMKEVRVQQNTEVIVQGAVGDFFYVVEAGEFEVWVKPQASHRYDPATKRTISDQHPPKMVARIDSGGSFGELALMYNAPRAATVISVSPTSTLWALDRVTFRSILMEHSSRKRKMYEHFLGEVNILVSLEPHERAKIADALEEKVYEEGEAVVIEGEVGKNFYIIESGQAQVLKRQSNGHDEEVSNLGRGDYFGELALMNSAPRAATVRAAPGTGRLRVATLGEKAFTRLLGPVVDILQRRAERTYNSNAGGGNRSSSAHPESSRHSSRGPSVGPEHGGRSHRSGPTGPAPLQVGA